MQALLSEIFPMQSAPTFLKHTFDTWLREFIVDIIIIVARVWQKEKKNDVSDDWSFFSRPELLFPAPNEQI